MNARFVVFVPGVPVPQGSKTAFISKSTGRPIVVDKDMRLPQWRAKVTSWVMDAMPQQPIEYPLLGPIGIRVDFILARPKGHFGTGKNAGMLRAGAPKHPASMPDVDKLLRAIFDALTDAQVWRDDGQVVWVQATKHYVNGNDPVGVGITLGEMQ